MKRKAVQELQKKDGKKEPSSDEPQVEVIEKKKETQLKPGKSASSLKSNNKKLKPPTLMPANLLPHLPTSIPPQNVNLSGPPLIFNGLIPSSRILTPDRIRDLIPFDPFMNATMRIIQIMKHRDESLVRNRTVVGDRGIPLLPRSLFVPTVNECCYDCTSCQKILRPPPQ